MAASLIIAGIVAGGSLAAAKISSDAVKKSAETQGESADKALDVQERMYEQDRTDLGQSREDLHPYRALGSGSVGLLGQGLGINIPAYQAPVNPVAMARDQQQTVFNRMQTQLPTPASTPTTTTAQNQGLPNLSTLGQSAPPVQQAAQLQSQSSYSVRAPNGQTYRIPASKLSEALANGGQQVS